MSAVPSPKASFYTGIPVQSPFPLARFLPPYHRHTVTYYFRELTPQSSQPIGLILDPFGASPFLSIELANAGAAVVVCCNNPILEIYLRVMALSPSLEEFQTILAAISAVRKLDTRLETFLRSLYDSTCNSCLAEVEVDAYIWEKESSSSSYRMVYKQYRCPQCGNEGLYPITIFDQQLEQRLPPRSLIESQAVSKIIHHLDPAYPSVIDILVVYPTRSLYAITTLLNKLDELEFDQRQQIILHGLLIGAFDFANALWGYPLKRQRPKQLSLPNQFYEYNFWHSLEKSAEQWVNLIAESELSPIPIANWPRLPRPGQITIFSGRLKNLLSQMPKKEFSAVVTALPRPNQAFWSLCAIWSGWLEGRERVKPLKSVLSRKRYDWGWHCRALTTTFQELTNHLPENTPCFGLIEEYEANFLAATVLAADNAKLCLENLALRSDHGRAQIRWQLHHPNDQKTPVSPDDQPSLIAKVKNRICLKIQNHIDQTLEPAIYPQIHAVALASVVNSLENREKKVSPEHLILKIFPLQKISDYPNYFLTLFEEAIRSFPPLISLGGDQKHLETCLWWISEPHLDHLPFSDRVEKVVVDYLLSNTSASFWEIDQAVCSHLGHIRVPSMTLVQECLASYADCDQDSSKWRLRTEENPLQRARDVAEIREGIISLGKNLNYTVEVEEDQSLSWLDEKHNHKAAWHIQTNANIRNLITAYYSNVNETYLVIPGSRVNLILYKLRRYPFITQMVGKQFHIIRFRQIRWMISQPHINRSLFEEWLRIDPIKYQSLQLSLW